MKRKIIVLGSDFGTLDMVREAKKMDLYVIATDLMKTSPTKTAADEAWMISTTDIDLLEKKCREEKITAVMTGASDFNITCARELCKRLNLPIYCESDYAWTVARNKSEFKKICKEVGAPVAKDYSVTEELTEEELNAIHFPVVVKPVDNSGNKGMSYCKNREELRKAYKYARSVSKNNTIIVERQLHGPEWTVNYVLADGEIHLLYFSREHHQPGELANLYSLMNTSSCYLQKYIEEVNEKVIEVLKRAEFKEGIAWVEVMLDDDGHFYLIECGYRYGGDMSYASYEKVSGFNSIRWMLDICLGVQHTKNDLPSPLTTAYLGTAATYHLFALKDDVVAKIEGLDEIEKLPDVMIDMPKREGNPVKYHACMGTIRIYGKTCDAMLDNLKKINNFLRIENKNGENMFIRFTDYEAVRKEFMAGLKQFGL
ncbi:MAG: ATP-grasp domain-containing protein [Lachnospiraceae bacterium]|nr:ATP-grasp domain-containing protein [Lachnospiraceae bacterium]